MQKWSVLIPVVTHRCAAAVATSSVHPRCQSQSGTSPTIRAASLILKDDYMCYLSFETRYLKHSVITAAPKQTLKGFGGLERVGRINQRAEGQRLKE